MQANKTIRTDLSDKDKRQLLALLTEMRARNLDIPKVDKANIAWSDKWNIDENGFFRRNGAGKPYDPAGDRLFITGKNWSKLFEVRLKKK